jgi:hypothetical protein
MFLKPEVTKDFAARVGYRFATHYEARLDLNVWKTATELSELKPRDRIDVKASSGSSA